MRVKKSWMMLLLVWLVSFYCSTYADADAAEVDVAGDNAKLTAEIHELKLAKEQLMRDLKEADQKVRDAQSRQAQMETMASAATAEKEEALEAVSLALTETQDLKKQLEGMKEGGVSQEAYAAAIQAKEEAEEKFTTYEEKALARIQAFEEKVKELKDAATAKEGEFAKLTEEVAALKKGKQIMQSKAEDLKEKLEESQAKLAAAEKKTQAGGKALKEQIKKMREELDAHKEALENKYSAKVLTSDFVAGMRSLGGAAHAHSTRGLNWAADTAYSTSIKTKEALDPHIETATAKIGELTRQASESAMPLVEEHITPHYDNYLKPHVDTAWEKMEPVWRGTVKPKLIEGFELGTDLTIKGYTVAAAKYGEGRSKAVEWVNEQSWSEGNGEGIITAAIYIFVATILFLFRRFIFATIWAIIKFPFQVLYWSIFWPTLLFGSRKKKQSEEEEEAMLGYAGVPGNKNNNRRR